MSSKYAKQIKYNTLLNKRDTSRINVAAGVFSQTESHFIKNKQKKMLNAFFLNYRIFLYFMGFYRNI